MVRMEQLRPVSKLEKIFFPMVVTVLVSLLLPAATPLIGMLMLGNLLRECGVAERLSKTAQNELINIVTIFLGVTVGATAVGATLPADRAPSRSSCSACWRSPSAPRAGCCSAS